MHSLATFAPVVFSMPSRPGDGLTSSTKGPRLESTTSTPAIFSPRILAATCAMRLASEISVFQRNRHDEH